MTRDVTIHLVRHGQSEANLDKAVNRNVADHAVALSQEGRDQAAEVGAFLADLYAGKMLATVAVYVSPYRRTRETWHAIRARFGERFGEDELRDLRIKESIFLRELEFGLFDGVADEDLAREFPREHAYYRKLVDFEGEFYARMPSGEARCDVAQRVHQFFGTLQRDCERHGVTDAIVVSHGVTIRAFAMMWLGHDVEWFSTQRNPKNCSVRTLRGDVDEGYTFAGFQHAPASRQDEREKGEVG